MVSSKQKQSTAVYALVIVGVAFLFLFAKALLVPLAFALTLSLLLLPAVRKLEGLGVPRTFAVLLASAVACIVLFAGAALIYSQGLNVAQILVNDQARVEQRVTAMRSPAGSTFSRLTAMLEDVSGEIVNRGVSHSTPQPVEIIGSKSGQIQALEKLASATLEPLASIAVVIVFALYMLMNWEELRHRLLLLAGMSSISLMTRALDDAIARISEYLILQLEVNAAYGTLFGLILFCFHVPNAFLWGLIAGVLRIVPFVGTLIGMLLPLVLSLAVAPNWIQPTAVVTTFAVLEFSATNVMEPWLFSERTGISSLALLASAIFWSMLWGWPGLILSTPLTVCLVVLGRHVPQFSFLHSLMATNAKLSPPAHMYERLLAMDQEEVWAIAERYLSEHSLTLFYDSVLLPVLRSAENDRHRGILDAAQESFLILSLTELVSRLSEYQESMDDERSVTSALMAKLNSSSSKEFAVICVPVSDRADELATQMLVQVLERQGLRTMVLKPKTLTEEVLQALSRERSTVVALSVLPPMSFAQTHSLSRRLSSLLPNNRIVVGFWLGDEEPLDVMEDFASAGATASVTSMSALARQLNAWKTKV